MLDSLLTDLASVCRQILPIAGAVALIYLCILLKKAWKLLEQLSGTVKSLDPTISLANQSMEKIQAPLDTTVKISHSVDKVHDKTSEAISKAADFVNENIDKMKGVVKEKMEENHFETVDPDPAPQSFTPTSSVGKEETK